MTSIVLTTEELKAAPPEVRRWILGRVEADLVALASAVPTPPPSHAPTLSACTADEAAQVFDLIKGDFAATQVFLELARDNASAGAGTPLHAISIDGLMRHTRLDINGLMSCLQTVNQAFRQVREDAEAILFGFDQANHLFVHETTHHSIRNLWQHLVRQHGGETEVGEPVALPPVGFAPRRLGPSDDVATHQHQTL